MCPICGDKMFKDVPAYQAHMKMMHNIENTVMLERRLNASKAERRTTRTKAEIVAAVEAKIGSHLIRYEAAVKPLSELTDGSALHEGRRIAAMGLYRPERSKVIEMYPGYNSVEVTEFLRAWR